MLFYKQKLTKMAIKNKYLLNKIILKKLKSKINFLKNIYTIMHNKWKISIKKGNKNKNIMKKYKNKNKKLSFLNLKYKNLKMILNGYNSCSVIIKYMPLYQYHYKVNIFLVNQINKANNQNIGILNH